MINNKYPIRIIRNWQFFTRDGYLEPEQEKWFECGECHKHILKWYKFCPYCGTKLEWEHMRRKTIDDNTVKYQLG